MIHSPRVRRRWINHIPPRCLKLSLPIFWLIHAVVYITWFREFFVTASFQATKGHWRKETCLLIIFLLLNHYKYLSETELKSAVACNGALYGLLINLFDSINSSADCFLSNVDFRNTAIRAKQIRHVRRIRAFFLMFTQTPAMLRGTTIKSMKSIWWNSRFCPCGCIHHGN